MSLAIFFNDFCQILRFFPPGICYLSLLGCFTNKLRVILFTVVSLASTLIWSVKTRIFVIFCSFISVKERKEPRLLKSYVMYSEEALRGSTCVKFSKNRFFFLTFFASLRYD